MTERLARRGVPVVTEYVVDHLSQVFARDRLNREVVTLPADQSLVETREWLDQGAGGATHQGFPIVDPDGRVLGVLTRRDLLAGTESETRRLRELIHRPLVAVYEKSSLREVADLMVRERVGRVPVISSDGRRRLLGILSRSDLLAAHERRLDARRRAEPTIRFPFGVS